MDSRSNASPNAAWIRLINTGSSARQFRDMTISDASRHVYYVEALRLRPGRTGTVHTCDGSDTAAHRYWRPSEVLSAPSRWSVPTWS